MARKLSSQTLLKTYLALISLAVIYMTWYVHGKKQFIEDININFFDGRLLNLRLAKDEKKPPTFIYRYDNSRTGVAKNSTLQIPLQKKWEKENINIGIHSASKATPAVDESGVYVGSDSGWFFAFSHSGDLKWKIKIGLSSFGIHGTAALDEQFIYFNGYNGRLYKALKKTGEIIWVRHLSDAVGSSVLIEGDYIYVTGETRFSWSGYLLKLERESGKLIWKTRWIKEQIHSSPALSSDKSLVYFGANDGLLYAVNNETGQIVWSFASGGPIKGTPLVYSNLVSFTSWSGFVFSLMQINGKPMWKYKMAYPSQSSPTYEKEKDIIILSASKENRGEIFALKGKTGRLLWRKENNGRLVGSAVVGYNQKMQKWVAWTGCSRTSLCGIEAETGRTLQEINLGSPMSNMPTLWKQDLYVSLDEGPLMKYSGK